MLVDVKVGRILDLPEGPYAQLLDLKGDDHERDEAKRIGGFLLAALVTKRLTRTFTHAEVECPGLVSLRVPAFDAARLEERVQALRDAAAELQVLLPQILGREP